ncbi:hypothetical protein [Streptosporangium saharense]|uniref:hypothetical protein n=1 Tax=Streptosporangium saharense TaxID=1706840 RepID=UPI00344AD15C
MLYEDGWIFDEHDLVLTAAASRINATVRRTIQYNTSGARAKITINKDSVWPKGTLTHEATTRTVITTAA